MKNIIQGVWNIHLEDWSSFCRSIFYSRNWTIVEPKISITLLTLVTKYYCEAQALELPSSKQIWFKRDIHEYQTFSVDSLWRWISVSKRIIKTFKIEKNIITTSNNNKNTLRSGNGFDNEASQTCCLIFMISSKCLYQI